MESTKIREKISYTEENPRIIFNEESFILHYMELLAIYLEMEDDYSIYSKYSINDSYLTLPACIKGIMICEGEEERMCLIDAKLRIHLLLTKEQKIKGCYLKNQTNNLNNFKYHPEHESQELRELLLIKPCLDLKISYVKNGLYAVSFVIMCEDFQKGFKISHRSHHPCSPINNLYKTEYQVNDPHFLEFCNQLFKKVNLIAKMKDRLKISHHLNTSNLENLEEFFRTKDYLFLSNTFCENYKNIEDDKHLRNIIGFIYLKDKNDLVQENIKIKYQKKLDNFSKEEVGRVIFENFDLSGVKC